MSAELVTVRQVTIALEPGRHPIETEHAVQIDAGWQRRIAAKPRMYDGETVLGVRTDLADGRLSTVCRAVRYAGLLHFLGLPENVAAATPWRHVYAWPALVSSDGLAVMGRMAGHTANAGRIYFPSGSLEAVDFRDGVADLEGNMARELREETGLSLSEATLSDDWLMWQGARTMALIRVCRFGESAAHLIGRMEAFRAQTGEDELDAALAFAPGVVDEAMAPAARAFMRQGGWA
jgi:8-oxo-dGTP pyrophosphatase MutT (NUDIX family)